MPIFSLMVEVVEEWEIEAETLDEAKKKAREEFIELISNDGRMGERMICVGLDSCLICDNHGQCDGCYKHSKFHSLCGICEMVDVDKYDNIDSQGRIVCPRCFYANPE